MGPFKSFIAAVAASAALWVAPAQASLFSTIYAFGDSLIDTGNSASSQMPVRPPSPPPPYDNGRFTNGPTASEHLANGLGVPLVSYAVGGAMSGVGNVDVPDTGEASHFTGVLSQLAQYLTDSGGSADPSALYIVLGGSNDFLGLLASNPNPDAAAIDAVATDVIGNLVGTVTTLVMAGATQFLLPLLPDVGSAPAVQDTSVSAAMLAVNTALSQAYLTLLSSLADPSLNFIVFDTFAAQHGLEASFTNITDACVDATLTTICTDPDNHLFWDDLHPTARAHALLGNQLLALVPEPDSLALAGLAVAALWTGRRRRMRALAA